MQLTFFLPEMHRLYTGGNVFNRYLYHQLKKILPVKTIIVPSKFSGLNIPVSPIDKSIWIIDSLLLQNQDWIDFLQKQTAIDKFLLIHYLHLLDPRGKPAVVIQREKKILPSFQGFITTSQFSRECLQQAGIDSQRIAVIRPGIEHSHQPTDKRWTRPIPHLLTVSSIFPGKGLLEMVDILEKLTELEWRWHIIGENRLDKSFAQQFRNRVRASTINKRVKILSPFNHQELLKIYPCYDIFVLPSHFETCSMVTMESMAVGLPPMAWKVGGLIELVEHRKTGYLIPFGREKLFLKYLRKLILEKRTRQTLGEAAKKRSMNFTSWKESAEQLVNYFKTTYNLTT